MSVKLSSTALVTLVLERTLAPAAGGAGRCKWTLLVEVLPVDAEVDDRLPADAPLARLAVEEEGALADEEPETDETAFRWG